MFNWYSLPTFVAVLLFWLLAAYVITRSPREPVSLAAAAAQAATAAYLLGQAMQANAASVEEWLPWARGLQWSAVVAPTIWYWLTALLLREQPFDAAKAYLRRVGYPLGGVLALATLALIIAIDLDDLVYRWSAPVPALPYSRFHAPPGPLYPALVVLVLGATLGAAGNLWRAWWLPLDPQRRGSVAWLLVSALLFVGGSGSLALAAWLGLSAWPLWLSHLALAVGMALMALNVASYSLVLGWKVLRADLFAYAASLAAAIALYAVLFLLAGPAYSFELLRLLVLVLIVAVLSQGLADPARRFWDRLFFPGEVQLLRSELASAAQNAALARDLDAVLGQAQVGLAEVSVAHMARLTEQALRRLNQPSALARAELATRLPHTLAAIRARRLGTFEGAPTPLEQAQALRQALAEAIERLKPTDLERGLGAPAALQYHILREEYLQGLPNKQIMVRHSISEGTFHRNRREAIAILAQELARQEERLAQEANSRA